MSGPVEIAKCDEEWSGRRCVLVAGHGIANPCIHFDGCVVDGHLYAADGQDLSESIRTQIRIDHIASLEHEVDSLRTEVAALRGERDAARATLANQLQVTVVARQAVADVVVERNQLVRERDSLRGEVDRMRSLVDAVLAYNDASPHLDAKGRSPAADTYDAMLAAVDAYRSSAGTQATTQRVVTREWLDGWVTQALRDHSRYGWTSHHSTIVAMLADLGITVTAEPTGAAGREG